MELHEIELLVEKYMEGETSVKEEKELRAYFRSGNVDARLKEYQVLFGFFETERAQTYQLSLKKPNDRKKWYTWFGIAASIAIVIGLFMFNPTPQQEPGVIKDPEVALQKTKEVLNMIAQQMNNGKENLVYLTEIEKTKNELIETNLNLKK